jgi:hypothetical protein
MQSARAGVSRRPKDYVGRNHETIGSDIIAVVRSLEHLAADQKTLRLPKQILGAEQVTLLEQVKPDGWYPIAWLLDLMELIDARLGRYALMKMGRAVFSLSHAKRIRESASSGRDIVHGIDAMYHFANRGDEIGGWRVVTFNDARAELEKTTPHHCAMEEGILAQALAAVGSPAVITQEECFREGAELCRFVILPSASNTRWTGSKNSAA